MPRTKKIKDNKQQGNKAENTLFKRLDGSTVERAVCFSVCLSASDNEESVERSLAELGELAKSAGAEVLGQIYQKRDRIDKRYYVGEGKLAEIKEMAQALEANCLICDDELSPAQLRNIEEFTDLKIIDRSLLILDIFAGRATTAEGKLQVALAQEQYRLPRLQFMLGFNSRLGGGIGTRGPGETLKETDRRHIQRRISNLKAKLQELGKKREISRQKRAKSAYSVAIVGYTNAGKSSLINKLCKADLYAEDKVFATLDPAVKPLWLPDLHKDLLLIDTVGFIRKLPHHLVESFKSTLEEAARADVLLVVSDVSDSQALPALQVVEELLKEIGAASVPRIYVCNKMDLLDYKTEAVDKELLSYLHTLTSAENLHFISAAKQWHLEELKAGIAAEVQKLLSK